MSNPWREECLVDKTIVGIKVKSPSIWLQVKDGGWIEIEAEGDCCSQSYIDAVRLYGNPTLTGEEVAFSFSAQPSTQEADELYAVQFLGKGGSVTFLHRNSSNGYYGNFLNLKLVSEPPVDAVDGRDWYREVFSRGEQ